MNHQYEKGFGHAIMVGIGAITTIIALSLIPLNLAEKIQPGLTILGFFVGFGLLIFQLRKQNENTINLQKKQFKEKIQHDIFNEIRAIIDESANSYAKLSSKLFGITMKMDSDLFLSEFGIAPSPIKERPENYQDLHYLFSQSILKLIFILEKYTITDCIFEIFNMAFQSSMYDLSNNFRDIHDSLLKLLPVDIPKEDQERLGVKTIEPKFDKKKELSELKQHIRTYDTKLLDIISYIKDLEIEIQNILLSEIFDNTLQPRKHNDDEYIVISNNTNRSLDEIEHCFMYETEWGKNWQEAKKKVKNLS